MRWAVSTNVENLIRRDIVPNRVPVANLTAVSTQVKRATVKLSNESSRTVADRELMRELATGNETAMQAFIERYGAMLNQFVGRLVAWNHDQDDILQNVLITIWQRAGEFQGTGSLEGWIRRIAINRCRNHFRARAAFRRLVDLVAIRGTPSESAYNDELLQIENKELTRSALQKLKQQDRTILVLYYLEELSSDEIANLTGVKVATVHVQLHRARQRLRDQLNLEEQ